MIRKHQPHCVFLMETKLNIKRMDYLRRRLGFMNWEAVEDQGFSRGLLMIWNQDINMVYQWKHNRAICYQVQRTDDLKCWMIISCYGTPYQGEKAGFWEYLINQMENIQSPWILMGDLNEVINGTEKMGGQPIWRNKLYLKNFIDDLGAVDMGYSGRKFTWDNKHYGNTIIKERLDRMVACIWWILHYQRARVDHLLTEESDHALILLTTECDNRARGRPFRFLKV